MKIIFANLFLYVNFILLLFNTLYMLFIFILIIITTVFAWRYRCYLYFISCKIPHVILYTGPEYVFWIPIFSC
jgi:hypothetical protein